MVMLELNNHKWYEDKTFIDNLHIYLDAVKHDNDDLVIVYDGKEGAGKSKKIRRVAAYCANYLGTEFSSENVHFELDKYIDFSIEKPQYTVCVLDEARNVLNKKNSNSKGNKKFTNYMSECRSKNQVHILALPAFHDLDRYVVLWRMKFVVHMLKWFEKDESRKSGYKLGRGKYILYMNDDYLKDSYNYPYRYPRRWETKGQTPDYEIFDNTELEKYEQKKGDGLENKYHSKKEEEKLGKREEMWRTRWAKIVVGVKSNTNLKNDSIADMCDMNIKTLTSNLAQTQFTGKPL